MDKQKYKLTECHKLLQDILQSAFQIPVILFTPPYTDIKRIDLGLRAMVWTDYDNEQQNLSFGNNSRDYRLIIVKSNLGFCNIVVLFEHAEQPDFLAVGPFRDEELSANYFTRILKESHISPNEIQSLKQIYEQMPYAHPDAVTSVVKHVLSVYYPIFQGIVPELIQYSEQKRDIDINKELLEAYTVEHASDYRNSLFEFLSLVKTGISLTKYIQQTRIREALRLFNTTDFSVSDVSIMVGYQDFSYFSKVFSQQTGKSPRAYQKHR